MNIKILGKSMEAGIKQHMMKMADEYDPSKDTDIPKIIAKKDCDAGMYSNASTECINKINQLYAELKTDALIELHPIDSGGIQIKSKDMLLKFVRDWKDALFYLEGILYSLEQERAKYNVCMRCGAIFQQALVNCPKCRSSKWFSKARKYERRKQRLLNIKQKREAK
jgi:ribosomal protein L40E